MFDVFYSGTAPGLFAHEQQATSLEHAQQLSRTRYFWWINYLTDYTGWDFLWEPVPWQNQYMHVWPSAWHQFHGACLVPKHVASPEHHYHDRALPARQYTQNFKKCIDCEFDYSWTPHPWDPPYVYVFGNQWWPAVKMPTVEYHVPGAVERKYMPWPKATLKPTIESWTIPPGLDEAALDLSWVPDPGSPAYIYQFGTQWQKTSGPVYHVPGATEIKYEPWPRAVKNTKDPHWIIPDGADVESFDWTWHPDATEQPYIYQFGTQHQRTGGPQYHVPGAMEVKYVDQIRIRTQRVATAIIEIDHMDGNTGQIADVTKTVRYFDNYLDTLRRIAKNIGTEHEFVWICSSVCDYKDFDFTWHPEQWQATMLHVFASDGEKFGDTFFMHVPTFQYRCEQLKLLDWYDINFVGIKVPRRPLPVIIHDYDTHVEAVKTQTWLGPLAVFAKDPVEQVPCVSLWREKSKTIVPLAPGASQVIVPRVAVPYIRTQLYDYPHIDRTQRHLHNEQPLDIVFLENGEPNALDNLRALSLATASRDNRVVVSRGVTGRVAAYHAAAEMSTTPWFFAVFAKLKINPDFDWSWQPDRMQEPKHYIFHAFNPVNELTYGHQAMIAYNKKLVLENPGQGLDFTLDSAHEVVPILSGTADYISTPWMAWRTAFRECVKLCGQADVESQYRLRKWLEVNPLATPNAEWSRWGAEDAVEYHDSVGGAMEELRKSYDWSWLATYALIKRNLSTNQ